MNYVHLLLLYLYRIYHYSFCYCTSTIYIMYACYYCSHIVYTIAFFVIVPLHVDIMRVFCYYTYYTVYSTYTLCYCTHIVYIIAFFFFYCCILTVLNYECFLLSHICHVHFLLFNKCYKGSCYKEFLLQSVFCFKDQFLENSTAILRDLFENFR